MAVRSFQLTLAATALRLSDVYGGAAGADPSAALNVPYRQLFISARGAAAFLGAASTVTSTNYGTRAEVGAVGESPIVLGPFDSGPIKLSDFWAAGAGATLHIFGIPY